MGFRNIPGLHPRGATLNRYADRTLGAESMRRVGVHLIGCLRCREEVDSIHRLASAARGVSAPVGSTAMMERVLARRAAGERVILPVVDAQRVRTSSPWRFVAAAAVLIVAGGIALASSRSAAAAGDDSTLTFGPLHPRVGASLVAEYRPSERFASSSVLYLRAKFVSRESGSWEQANRPSRAERFVMHRTRDGVFRLSFALPADVILATFAVEDSLADHVDTHRGRLWELLTYSDDGRPRYDALVLAAHRRGRWESRYLAALKLVELYPDSAAGWVTRVFNDRVAHGRVDSATLALYRRTFERFDRTARQEARPSDDQFEALFWMADNVGDSTRKLYWRSRLLKEAPRSQQAVRLRGVDAIERLRPDTLAMAHAQPALERIWMDVTQNDGTLTTFGLQSAIAAKDPQAILRWGRRYLDMEHDEPGSVRWVARELTQYAETRADGLRLLRATLGPIDIVNDQRRRLSQTAHERQQELDDSWTEALQLIGEGLLADGQHVAALDSLLRASRVGWNVERFRSIASAALQAGDTTIATRMLALVALDPGAAHTFTDSARAMLGHSVSDATWRATVTQSDSIMRERVLATSVRKQLRGDRIRMLTSAGEERTFAQLAAGHITVVAFGVDVRRDRSPVDRDETQRLASYLASQGARLVAVSLEPYAPDVPALMRKHAIPFEVYFDEHHEANRAFDAYGFPIYFVVDAAGVIRFEYSEVRDLRIQVRVLSDSQQTPR